MIAWHCKTFSELTTQELYQIMYYRTQTFVVAQKRSYQEVDDVDPVAHHLWATKDGKLVAYFRIFKDHDHISFGRVLTTPDVRGQGLGGQLLTVGLGVINQLYPGVKMIINSQDDKEKFYAKYGFKAIGKPFVFHHTPHITMIKEQK
ncbi:GNAT family acetyltransferase [Philodulcilactobacillus myokoensis]|uniref:GNAT family acetyltransferase n=1 Tax=Philodulcilactobacillus myokoensis TaxID=2929573 RepID=A0A9W6B2Q8_9LACO|nr:GNAT family N-acetyltransferase [Philodulcilactobacillus myokoensis]GLB47295.1 GNAT family acetyltransferase [Philodulcilactobacillus myokoensis]